jgi:hypothetical protein
MELTPTTGGKTNTTNQLLNFPYLKPVTAPVVLQSEFLATDPEVPGSIPGATRFPEKSCVWNWVQSASWR